MPKTNGTPSGSTTVTATGAPPRHLVLQLRTPPTTTASAPPAPPDPGDGGTEVGTDEGPLPFPRSRFPGHGHRLGQDDSLAQLLERSKGKDLKAASACRLLRERGFLRYKGRWYPFRHIPKVHLRSLLRKLQGTQDAHDQRETITAAQQFLDAHEREREPMVSSLEDDWQWRLEDWSTDDVLILAERNLGAASGEVRRELRRRFPGLYGSSPKEELEEVEPIQQELDEVDQVQLLLLLSFLKSIGEDLEGKRIDHQNEADKRLELIGLFVELSAAANYLPFKCSFHRELAFLRDQLRVSDLRSTCLLDFRYYKYQYRRLREKCLEIWTTWPLIILSKQKRNLNLKETLNYIGEELLVSGSVSLKNNRNTLKNLTDKLSDLCCKSAKVALDQVGVQFEELSRDTLALFETAANCQKKDTSHNGKVIAPPPLPVKLGEYMGHSVFGCIHWAKIALTVAGSKLTAKDKEVYEKCLSNGIYAPGDKGNDGVKPEGHRAWVVKVSFKTGQAENMENVISPCAIERREKQEGKPDKIILIFDHLVNRHPH